MQKENDVFFIGNFFIVLMQELSNLIKDPFI